MATIRSDETGMLVEAQGETAGTYYYVADSFGQPCTGGYKDQEKAEQAFDAAGDETQWPEADFDLNEVGEPAAEIEAALAKVTEALGNTVATDAAPCGTVAYYDAGASKPWRISDDHNSQTYCTLDEPVEGATEWVKAYAEA